LPLTGQAGTTSCTWRAKSAMASGETFNACQLPVRHLLDDPSERIPDHSILILTLYAASRAASIVGSGFAHQFYARLDLLR
jgi:hypothetical protein